MIESRRPGPLWWLLAIAATAVALYGITMQDGRPRKDAVPGLPWLDELHFVSGGVALLVGVWGFRRDLLSRRRPGKRHRGGRRCYRWAELLWRVYGVDVFTCPRCGGARRLLSAILDPASIERVLRAMGLPCEVPELAPARAPPGGEQGWFGA